MNRTRFAAVCLAGTLALLAGVAVHANTAEVTGEIKDTNGDPVQGALVRCWAASNPSLVYDGKTNKKGRFYIPGLVHPRQDDVFVFEIEYEGWVPVEVTIENRTVNRVLLGDPLTKKLAPGQEIPKVPIVPLGKARLDATLAPPDVAAELSAAGATETAEAAPVPDRRGARPSADPYQEALTLAGAGDAEGPSRCSTRRSRRSRRTPSGAAPTRACCTSSSAGTRRAPRRAGRSSWPPRTCRTGWCSTASR